MANIRKRVKGQKKGWMVVDRWQKQRNGTIPDKTGHRWKAAAWDAEKRVGGKLKPGYTYESSFTNDDAGYLAAKAWAEAKAKAIKSHDATATTFALGDIGKRYVEHLRTTKNRNPRHVAQVEQCIDLGVKAGLGDILDELYPDRVEAWLAKLTTSHALPASVSLKNKFLGFLKAISVHARKRHRAPINRLEVVDALTREQPFKEVYTVPELRRMLAPECASDPIYAYIALMVYVGCRPSEAKALTWADVDFEADSIRLRAEAAGNKFGRENIVPLQSELADILRPIRKVGAVPILSEPWASHKRADCLLDAVREYLNRCKVTPKKMLRHSFRNTFGSLHAAMGTNFAEVRDMMGHRDVRVAADYQSVAKVYKNDVKGWRQHEDGFFLIRSVATREASGRKGVLEVPRSGKK